MSEPAADEQMFDSVELVAWHRPALGNGAYQITVQQRLAEKAGGSRIPPSTVFTTRQTFRVEGARFSLQPSDVQALFPPEGNLGDHSLALPHIVLERSTLPWERSANGNQATPWLALLLFYEDEIQHQRVRDPEVTTVGAIKRGSAGRAALWPELKLEPWQSDDQKLTVVDVRRSLLAEIAPTAADLSLLAHVRRGKEAGGLIGPAQSVIVSNRLPKSGGISVAHLVSVEGRYDSKSGLLIDLAAPMVEGDPYIRLISLRSWRFASITPTQDLVGLLKQLDREPGVLRLPLTKNVQANRYLSQGYVALPYAPRQGEPTVAWYRGPLLPCASGPSFDPDARAADMLLRYDPTLDMYDISYAAAWELGRLLLLRSRSVSVGLYNWKRAHVQERHRGSQRLLPLRLATTSAELDYATPPPEVLAWFEDLRLLRGVPLSYLVPDPQLLPPESIRFFQIDDFWLDCLLDGAFSIGQTTIRSDIVERLQQQLLTARLPNHGRLSGVLLRSEVVAGWPALRVDASDQPLGASDATAPKLLRLRKDRVASDVLLCLFAGDLRSLAIHLSPEALHFSLDRLKQAGAFASGKPEWLNANDRISVANLAGKLRAASSAELGRKLIARVPLVLLEIDSSAVF